MRYFDPYCPTVKRGGSKTTSIDLTQENLAAFDAAIVATAHKKGVDYDLVAAHIPLILDTKNVFDGEKFKNVVLL